MQIIYLASFLKDLKKIKDAKVLSKVKKALLDLQALTEVHEDTNIVKIKGHPTAYRKRIGDYRMGLFILNDTITVARFVKRNDIYKLFP
ncbi:MAG: plasmid stabilization protein [Bacteroidetes bacterium]|nr:MAG: plasmid stabilization protein [Bacteroidota bacterium]